MKSFIAEDSFWELFPQAAVGVVVVEGMKPAAQIPQEDVDAIAALLDPCQYRCGASSDQRYNQRERTGQGMARGLSSVQDQKGRALFNREPAQARAQGQAGGPHYARGGYL